MSEEISVEAFMNDRTLLDCSEVNTMPYFHQNKMNKDKRWASGQKSLWEEVTDERGQLRWTRVDDVEDGVRMCVDEKGRDECEDAVMELVWS